MAVLTEIFEWFWYELLGWIWSRLVQLGDLVYRGIVRLFTGRDPGPLPAEEEN